LKKPVIRCELRVFLFSIRTAVISKFTRFWQRIPKNQGAVPPIQAKNQALRNDPTSDDTSGVSSAPIDAILFKAW